MDDAARLRGVRDWAVQSGRWALLARLSHVLGISATMVVLPLWLKPADYGVITVIASVLALAFLLQQPGLVEATIQSETAPEAVRDAALWMSLLVGAVVYAAVFLLAPPLATFFRESRLALPLRVGGVQILLAAATNVLLAWMQRRFLFRQVSIIQFAGSGVMVAVAIGLAAAGFGYWSYIAGLLLGGVARMLFALLYSDWRPRLAVEPRWWRVVFGFGGFVLVELILGWILAWFDNLTVAKNLGSSAAGTYALGFGIATAIISLPCSAISGVTLSVFSRLQGDRMALRATLLRGVELIAAYSIPAGIGLAILGPAAMATVYPDIWDALGSVLTVLALYAGFGHLWILNSDAYKAIGRPEIMAKIYLPIVAIMLPLYWWSSKIGLLEFTLARSSVILIGLLPHTYFAVRYLGLRKDYLWAAVKSPLLASLPMALTVWVGVSLLRGVTLMGPTGSLGMIIALALIGAAVYWAGLRRLSPGFAHHAVLLFRRSLGANPG